MHTAIIYIPASHPFDGQRARNGLDHLARRGYEFFTILRNWAAVDMHLAVGSAEVVVFASTLYPEDHTGPGGSSDERTRALRRHKAAIGRHRVAAHLPIDASQRFGTGIALAAEVEIYQSGYADGYVDCATVKAAMTRPSECPLTDSPTGPL